MVVDNTLREQMDKEAAAMITQFTFDSLKNLLVPSLKDKAISLVKKVERDGRVPLHSDTETLVGGGRAGKFWHTCKGKLEHPDYADVKKILLANLLLAADCRKYLQDERPRVSDM